MQLSDTMQTSCPHCASVFRITADHLEMARGQVRCGECNRVFNALLTLENFTGPFEDVQIHSRSTVRATPGADPQEIDTPTPVTPPETPATEEPVIETPVSLSQAMYGDGYSAHSNFRPLLWTTGILLLLIAIIVQTIYYQRYQLIADSRYQQQILNLCQILPCDESRFSSLSQIKLLERNIFTHPTRSNALMVSGSFINEASFSQSVPDLLISLSDSKGNFIANRLFKAEEYLTDPAIRRLSPGKPIQFRIEILDPGNEALAYEFEFSA